MVSAKVQILSRDEFLGLQGLSSPISGYLDDKLRGNRNFSSGNQRERSLRKKQGHILIVTMTVEVKLSNNTIV